jgi:CRISPR-associated protein Csb2
MFVVSLDGPALPLEATLRLTRTVRASLMKHSEQPPCEALSGHQSNGKQTMRPHAAIIPMSFIDSEYADGDIKGFGLVLPHNLTLLERRQILQALARTKELVMPAFGQWQIFPVTDLELAKASLHDGPYAGTCTSWATVTPIVLDRFPKRLIGDETQEIIALACERIGLPKPIDISVSEVSVFRGVPPSFAFPTLTLTGKPMTDWHFRSRVPNGNGKQEVRPRLRVHARVQFAVPVRGPLLLGAGRYLGMGTCRMFREKN